MILSMNELTSSEVPQKFAEWLFAMGCHSEVVPAIEKISEKCRGQYYMVWRSLMTKVEPKDVIKNKRPQVFCDDIRRCQKKNVLNERDVNIVIPEELLLWHRHTQLKEKVAETEAKVRKHMEEKYQLEEKNNSKFCQLNLLRKRLQDRQRQALLLQRLADELRNEKDNLLKTKTIMDTLCGLDEDADVESTLDKCIASLTRQNASSKMGGMLLSAANPVANTTFASITSENSEEEVLTSLAQCRGEELFRQLHARRAGLCAEIPTKHPDSAANTKRVRSLVSHTVSLHCSLALSAKKNRIHTARIRDKLEKTFLRIGNHLSNDACELLVSQCEVACCDARIASLQSSCEEILNRAGEFAVDSQDSIVPATSIQNVDRAIESKRDELKRLIVSVAVVERKTQNVRECLLSRFNSFHEDSVGVDRYGGATPLPQESISSLLQFYEGKREKLKNRRDLSMNLDTSNECSFNNLPDNGNLTFIDELKFYLNKFSLEKNRKVVLENGEKIWLFESISSSIHDIHKKWQNEDITTSLLFPCIGLNQNLSHLLEGIGRGKELETLLQALGPTRKIGKEIDIASSKEEEEKTLDRIKKRLNDNILSLQKTSKNLDVCLENLHHWADNSIRTYISDGRKVDGRNYMQYEKAYLNNF